MPYHALFLKIEIVKKENKSKNGGMQICPVPLKFSGARIRFDHGQTLANRTEPEPSFQL
jgi:hypothetical protein